MAAGMAECTECGVEIPAGRRKCLACSKKAIQRMFSESPELKQAFKETVEEMRRPENISKMTAEIMPVVQAVAELHKAAQREEGQDAKSAPSAAQDTTTL